MVQLHTSGRYNIRRDFLSRNGTKTGRYMILACDLTPCVRLVSRDRLMLYLFSNSDFVAFRRTLIYILSFISYSLPFPQAGSSPHCTQRCLFISSQLQPPCRKIMFIYRITIVSSLEIIIVITVATSLKK